jgi:hypothetical protein
MPNLTANRHALKLISQLHVDSQFSHQYGTQVFNYNGEINDSYKTLCVEFKTIIADLEKTLSALNEHIPKLTEGQI